MKFNILIFKMCSSQIIKKSPKNSCLRGHFLSLTLRPMQRAIWATRDAYWVSSGKLLRQNCSKTL